ncbi:MAG: tryptophan--tRNA ligase [Euryarchaeota archaeon]|nr:tryptophan--tRNA ligase [Euryarchaeota archaeon]
MRIDPWSSTQFADYARLRDEFGISAFDYAERLERLAKDRGLPSPPPIITRNIIFGHRGFDSVFRAIEREEPWAVLTGLMPSGPMHFGHKMVIDQVMYYQSLGADVFITVADIEAYSTRGLSLEETERLALKEYIENYAGLGLKPEVQVDGRKATCQIYFQSKRAAVKDLAWKLGKNVNWSTMEAIYGFTGETNLGHVQSPLVQVGDILHVQLPEYGGPRPVVVPVGVDQDPHIRLTRDLASSVRFFKIGVKDKGGFVSLASAQNAAAVDSIFKMIPGGPGQGERRAMHRAEGASGDDARVKKVETILEHVRKEAILPLGFDEKHVKVNAAYGLIELPSHRPGQSIELDAALSKLEVTLGGYGFIPPASTYHSFMSGLTGGKMSSSKPETHMALREAALSGEKKIKGAKTGGRETAEIQRRLGGEAERCVIYEMYLFHLSPDDSDLKEKWDMCKTGKRLCGECKGIAATRTVEFLSRQASAVKESEGAVARMVKSD